MKRVVTFLGVMMAAGVGLGQGVVPEKGGGLEAQPVAVLLEQGVYQEETSGNLEGAAKTYHQIVERASVTRGLVAQALYRLAAVQVKQKQMEEARQTVERLKMEYPEQKDLIAKAQGLMPRDAGKSEMAAAGRPATAQEKAEAVALVAQGEQLMQERKFEAANKVLYQAALRDPNSLAALNGWGWSVLNIQGNPESAFRRALAIDPRSAAALNGLGWWLKRGGKLDEAADYWRQALESDGSATSAMSGLAQYAVDRGRYDEAVGWYQKWLKVDPENADANIGMKTAQRMQGMIKDATVKVDEFLKDMDEAKYAESWGLLDARSSFGQTGDSQAWEEYLKVQRAPLGKMMVRRLDRSDVAGGGRGAGRGGRGGGGGGRGMAFGPGGTIMPEATGAQFQFITQFEHKKDVYEQVTAVKNDNGEWRVESYSIRTPQLGVDPLKAR